jgi:hypothetical protein
MKHRGRREEPRSRYRRAAVFLLATIALAGGWWLFSRRDGARAPEDEAEGEPQFTSLRSFHYAKSILWGKLEKGLFSPLVEPRYTPAKEAETFLADDDRVFLVPDKEGGILVFPEILMSIHHVVNDVIASEPLAVTTCHLSGSCALYSRVIDQRVLTLGVSGLLYGGNSVLRDQETESLWLQLNGEAFEGPLAGRRLARVGPLEVRRWRSVPRSETTRVLAPVHGIELYRNFREGLEEDRFGLEVARSVCEPDDRLEPYTQGFGVVVRGESRFFPRDLVRKNEVLCDEVGGWGIALVYDPETDSCSVFRRHVEGRRLTFRADGEDLIDEETGSRWNRRGECLEGALAGRRLATPSYTRSYWFAWAAVYPRTGIS